MVYQGTRCTLVHSELGTIKAISIRTLLAWVAGRARRFHVSGNSMNPVLRNGDWVFVRKGDPDPSDLKVGDILVARHPYIENSFVVKRLSRVTENGFFLLGDNPKESTDSRTLGAFPLSIVVGKVEVKWSTNKSN